jgi:hypothetical protein
MGLPIILALKVLKQEDRELKPAQADHISTNKNKLYTQTGSNTNFKPTQKQLTRAWCLLLVSRLHKHRHKG